MQPGHRCGSWPHLHGGLPLSRSKTISFGTAFASVHPGFEHLLLEELLGMGIQAKLTEGGVSFPGSLTNLHTAHVSSRFAGRILVRLGTVKAGSLDQLAASTRLQPWKRFVHPHQNVRVDVTSHGSRLRRKDAVSRKVTHAIRDALRGPRLSSGRPPREPARVMVRIIKDRATLSMDASGDLLHRRGWRKATARAPLRENLAAAILEMAEWDPSQALADPMCGSGTFGIEAATYAAGLLPGADRRFAFHTWPGVDARKLPKLRGTPALANVLMADRSIKSVEAATSNARRAGVFDKVRLEHTPLEHLEPHAESGVLVANPPWGGRIGDDAELEGLYRRWGRILRERWGGWTVALVLPQGQALHQFGLGSRIVCRFEAGGKPVVVGISAPR